MCSTILFAAYLNINKDFLRAVFKEEKGMFKNNDVCKIMVPQYEELSVSALMDVMSNDEVFLFYFPDKMAKGRQIDRAFFFNVFKTLYSENWLATSSMQGPNVIPLLARNKRKK